MADIGQNELYRALELAKNQNVKAPAKPGKPATEEEIALLSAQTKALYDSMLKDVATKSDAKKMYGDQIQLLLENPKKNPALATTLSQILLQLKRLQDRSLLVTVISHYEAYERVSPMQESPEQRQWARSYTEWKEVLLEGVTSSVTPNTYLPQVKMAELQGHISPGGPLQWIPELALPQTQLVANIIREDRSLVDEVRKLYHAFSNLPAPQELSAKEKAATAAFWQRENEFLRDVAYPLSQDARQRVMDLMQQLNQLVVVAPAAASELQVQPVQELAPKTVADKVAAAGANAAAAIRGFFSKRDAEPQSERSVAQELQQRMLVIERQRADTYEAGAPTLMKGLRRSVQRDTISLERKDQMRFIDYVAGQVGIPQGLFPGVSAGDANISPAALLDAEQAIKDKMKTLSLEQTKLLIGAFKFIEDNIRNVKIKEKNVAFIKAMVGDETESRLFLRLQALRGMLPAEHFQSIKEECADKLAKIPKGAPEDVKISAEKDIVDGECKNSLRKHIAGIKEVAFGRMIGELTEQTVKNSVQELREQGDVLLHPPKAPGAKL